MTVVLSLRELCASTTQLTTLRTICIHEAAHAAVAREFGQSARWTVWLDFSEPDSPRWLGRTKIFGDAPVGVDRIVALAGKVATELDETPYAFADDIHDAIRTGLIKLSKEDAEMAAGYRLKDVRLCVHHVLRLMPSILDDAGRFLAHLYQQDESEAPEWASTIEQLRHATQPGQPRYEQSRLSSPRDDRRVVGYI